MYSELKNMPTPLAQKERTEGESDAMEWIETKETSDRYRVFKENTNRFTIVDKPNAFEMVCNTEIDGIRVLTTYRHTSLYELKRFACLLPNIISA